MQHLRPALVLIALFTLLTGIALPLAFTGAATAIVPGRANGSLLVRNGRVIGSALIGQDFTAARYFHGRPSATTATDPNDPDKTVPAPYDASASGASNLGPTSKALLDRVAADMKQGPPGPPMRCARSPASPPRGGWARTACGRSWPCMARGASSASSASLGWTCSRSISPSTGRPCANLPV
jgi:hypothetical protein